MNRIATGKASIMINLYLFHLSISYWNALHVRYFLSIRNKRKMGYEFNKNTWLYKTYFWEHSGSAVDGLTQY